MKYTEEDYPRLYLYRRVVQAKLFIDEHHHEKIDLHNIAEEAHFSKYHFLRLFKSIYGKTPYQYLIEIRITKAQQLLKEGKIVSEVCFAVGFESLSSFASLFKKVAGISPSSYRDLQRKRNADMERSPLKFVPYCFAKDSVRI